MSETVRELSVDEALFDALMERRAREDEAVKRVRRAHSSVSIFVHTSTERAAQEGGKRITALPEQDEEVIALADSFGVVADQMMPKYLDKIVLNPRDFESLREQVEQAAAAIDPARPPYVPSEPTQ